MYRRGRRSRRNSIRFVFLWFTVEFHAIDVGRIKIDIVAESSHEKGRRRQLLCETTRTLIFWT